MPDGFWVIGQAQTPVLQTNIMVTQVKESSHNWRLESDWFISERILKVVKTAYGYLFVAKDALWKWEEVIFDGGKWIKD